MRNLINEALKILGIMTVVTLVWRGLELLLVGEIMPNKVDSIVGTLLTISLYENFKEN